MKPLALITRPRADALSLAAELHVKGYDTLIEPMLRAEWLPGAHEALARAATQAQALIATSRYAIPMLAEHPALFDLPLYTPGDATADTARQAGFTQVHTVEGAAEAAAAVPEGTHVLYARGEDITEDLSGILLEKGCIPQQITVYSMRAAGVLSVEAQAALTAESIKHAPFLSTRTAEIFMGLVAREGLDARLGGCEALAFSPAIAEKLSAFRWKSIRICPQPTLPALLAMMDIPAATR